MKPLSGYLLKRCVFIVSVLSILSGTTHGLGFWLPWAGEEDKVKKTVEDVWQAMIWNDKRSLKAIVSGPAAQSFIDQETAQIKNLNIKSYKCRFKSVKVDQVQGRIAFVEYDKVATLKDGNEIKGTVVSVMEKVGGEWKMMTGYKTRKTASERAATRQGKTSDADAPAAVNTERARNRVDSN